MKDAMRLPPAPIEEWLRHYYFENEIDISGSGVEDYSLGELRRMLEIPQEELDALVFHDSHALGAPGLRRALAARWTEGREDWVMATHGSTEAIFLTMNALLEPGDEVVALEPLYPQLFAVAAAIGCRLRRWSLRFEDGFEPDLDALDRLLTPRTRMVIVNFPHNPTGTTLSPRGQEALLERVALLGAYLVWDGAFTEMAFDAPALPDPTLLYERVLSFGTLSKAYGLPGLRVGWCLAAPELLAKLVRWRDYITLTLSPLVELLAQKAIERPEVVVAPRMERARANREVVRRWVEANGDLARWVPTRGGVTAFPRFPRLEDTRPFCRRLLEEEGVLLVPGDCFGHPAHVRLGFGGPTAVLAEGLERLARLLERLARREIATVSAATP